MSSPDFFDILLSPITMVFMVVLFFVLLILLVVLRKRLSVMQKLVLGTVFVFCLLYLVFVLWLIIMFAGHSTAADPVRQTGH